MTSAVALVNSVNLTSAVGWAVASVSGCSVRARGGFWEASGYRWRFPRASAFTVGCVVVSRRPLPESVWAHEVAHMRQYAVLGPLLWPAYALAAGYSLLRVGDWWSLNPFERRAGLRAGGYTSRAARDLGAA